MTTRRFADKPAQRMLKQAQACDDIEVELVDRRDHPLPFFDEMASNMWMPSQNPKLYVGRRPSAASTATFSWWEYNRSITGVLKNALDQAYKEWNRKPFTAIGYGGTGASRAIKHLRGIAVKLRMVSTDAAVHIGGGDLMAAFPMGGNKPIEEIEANLLPSANTALDELVWWANATMVAKAAELRSLIIHLNCGSAIIKGFSLPRSNDLNWLFPAQLIQQRLPSLIVTAFGAFRKLPIFRSWLHWDGAKVSRWHKPGSGLLQSPSRTADLSRVIFATAFVLALECNRSCRGS